jgi:uncharacterized protein (DUF58 family)
VKSSINDLLKPEIIHSLSGLELIAKVVTEEMLHGLNSSKTLGVGGDFNQYRSYQAGDDARQIDWKVYGRSERYYTKLTERETHVKVKFLVDASESMLHEEGGISKMDYAKVLVASLGYLTHMQGDALGLFALNESLLSFPVKSHQQYSHFLFQLDQIKPSGRWVNDPTTIYQIHNPKEQELIIMVTDLYEYDSEIFEVIKQLKTQRNEVVVLLVSGHDERNFNYSGTLMFEELESKKSVKVNAKAIKSAYLQNVDQKINDVKNDLLKVGVTLEEFVMGEDLGKTLHLFLSKRKFLK